MPDYIGPANPEDFRVFDDEEQRMIPGTLDTTKPLPVTIAAWLVSCMVVILLGVAAFTMLLFLFAAIDALWQVTFG